MKNLNNLKLLKLTLIVCVLSLSLVSCKNKLPKFKLCTTLESGDFACADQRVPDEREGKIYKYQPGWICMPPDDYKIVYDHMISQAKYIAQLENRTCN